MLIVNCTPKVLCLTFGVQFTGVRDMLFSKTKERETYQRNDEN